MSHQALLSQCCLRGTVFYRLQWLLLSLLFQKTLSPIEERLENCAWSWMGLGVSRQPLVAQGWGMCSQTLLTVLPWRQFPAWQISFRMSTLVSPLPAGAAPVARRRPEMAPKAFQALFPNVWCKWKGHWAWVASWSLTYPHPRESDVGQSLQTSCWKRYNQTSSFSRGSLLAVVCSPRQSSWPLIPSSLTARGYCHLSFARFIWPAVYSDPSLNNPVNRSDRGCSVLPA